MSDKPAPWTLPADAASYWSDMYREAAARIETLEMALLGVRTHIKEYGSMVIALKIIEAALDKDAGQ